MLSVFRPPPPRDDSKMSFVNEISRLHRQALLTLALIGWMLEKWTEKKGGKRFFITFRILRLKPVVMRKAERYVKQEIILFIEKISFLILQKTVRQ